ncbi:hypothetical protein BGZ51_009322 [Haplosporangium sp. Z 767]|nr:hypothetical protein BGZ51_009322 [Haplosporangium sp. Z 767]
MLADEHFDRGDYLLADAAYALLITVILRYKNAGEKQSKFNIRHGSARVAIEYEFDMLKLKLQSFTSLLVKTNKRSRIDDASDWILVCVVIHNIIRLDADEEIANEGVRRDMYNRLIRVNMRREEVDENADGEGRR